MGLQEEFDAAVKDWKKHCNSVRYSSNPRDYYSCDAYRRIVAMGSRVLPLVKDVYADEKDDDSSVGFASWSSIVGEIVGEDFQIPSHMAGVEPKIRVHTINWLEKNMKKYVK